LLNYHHTGSLPLPSSSESKGFGDVEGAAPLKSSKTMLAGADMTGQWCKLGRKKNYVDSLDLLSKSSVAYYTYSSIP
jgi:hypothetical protein